MRCSYDDSLPQLLAVLTRHDAAPTADDVVLRDASGQLAVFFAKREFTDEQRAQMTAELRAAVAPYLRMDRSVVCHAEVGAARILGERARVRRAGETSYRYLDRRIAGTDWLLAPSPVLAPGKRFVFASLKGGVGRSTAISVVAADAARRGKNVLVVDLDLEAPGVGGMLLSEDRVPRLGALDYLVDLNFGRHSESLDDIVGTSALTHGMGLVDVVPVVGKSSLATPENVLAKLARVVVEGIDEAGDPVPVAQKLAYLLDDLEKRRSYDLVLIDARAGLAELAAGPILSLGANVLLFGTAQRQTLEGFEYLFAHLATLLGEDERSPWSLLKMVHAKATTEESVQAFRDQLAELAGRYLYEEATGLDEFNFDLDDPTAPHAAIVILNEPAFADWNPADEAHKLLPAYYERTFGALLKYVAEAIDA